MGGGAGAVFLEGSGGMPPGIMDRLLASVLSRLLCLREKILKVMVGGGLGPYMYTTVFPPPPEFFFNFELSESGFEAF